MPGTGRASPRARQALSQRVGLVSNPPSYSRKCLKRVGLTTGAQAVSRRFGRRLRIGCEPRLEQPTRDFRLTHDTLPQHRAARIVCRRLAIRVRELDSFEAGVHELLVQDGVIKTHRPVIVPPTEARRRSSPAYALVWIGLDWF